MTNREKCARYRERRSARGEPAPPPARPIPLTDRTARVQRDAQDLVFILRRYMLRSTNGVTYLRLRPKDDDPKHRTVVLQVERLVTGIWDAALGNKELGFAPVDPRTNRESSRWSAGRQRR